MVNPQHESPDLPAKSGTSDVTVAVLAAGNGTRMRSDIPKHLHHVAGVPIVERVIRAGLGAGASETIVMVNSSLSELTALLGMDTTFRTVVQGPPKGTGDSVRQALELSPDCRWLVSLLGDSPLLTTEVVASLLQHATSSGCKVTLLTCTVEDAATYGRIERDAQGRVTRIVEYRNDAPQARIGQTEINSGVMVLDAPWALAELSRLPKDPTTGEFLLTDLIDVAVQQGSNPGSGWPVDTYVADASVSLGVNDRVQLADVDSLARTRIRDRHMRAGVTIIEPNTVIIDEDVMIGMDTIVRSHSVLTGSTVVGNHCDIGPAAVVESSTLGDDVRVDQSTIRDSSVGSGSAIGPYAHLRRGCHLGEHVHVGSHAEMKATELSAGAKCGHVSYIGDAYVGEGANIGAGTITANYDGVRKHRTVVGKGAFVGSDSVLVAPITIGENAKTGAGSVVTRDVPDNTLVMGVPARPKPLPGDVEPDSRNER